METADFPLVSLCVLTYNQEKYIRETIQGVLSQDYPNLEIIISDDNSSDSTWDIILESTEKYDGPHKLIVNRNKSNLGIVGHCNRIMYEVVRGELIMLTGGDDVCLANTVSVAVKTIENSNCCAMTFNAYIIDGDSNSKGLKYSTTTSDKIEFDINDYLTDSYYSTGACRIIRKEVIDTFGPLNNDCQTEDTTNLLRCFLYGKFGYCNTPCIKYRVHGNNISSVHNLMTKFDPEKICAQYRKDLITAKEKGFVSNDICNRLNYKFNHYLSSSIAKRKIYSQPNKLLQYIKAISYIFLSDFKIKDIKSFLIMVHGWE